MSGASPIINWLYPRLINGTSQVKNTTHPSPVTANSKNYLKYYEHMIFCFQHMFFPL